MTRKREECRVCGFVTPEPVLVLRGFPLVAGPVTQVPRTVPTCDLEVGLCPGCGTCVLLNADVDSLEYDSDYTSSNIAYGCVGDMDKQTDRFADFVGRAAQWGTLHSRGGELSEGKPRGSKVLEIGCYDGVFMDLLEKRYQFNMLGCEPCIPLAEEARRRGYNVLPNMFNAADYDELDMVVARNILEHVPSPGQFVEDTTIPLKRDGTLVLEVPAGEHFIRNGILGTIVPEHPCYFGKDSLERLLGNCFKEIEVEEGRATIRARASFPHPASGGREVVADTTQLRAGGQIRQRRHETVREAIGDGKVDIFGANTCALELIAAGTVKLEQVDRVYDDDPRRWGRYLVNTDLVVRPRSAIGERQKVIVCSYTHRWSIADYIVERNSAAVKLYGDDE